MRPIYPRVPFSIPLRLSCNLVLIPWPLDPCSPRRRPLSPSSSGSSLFEHLHPRLSLLKNPGESHIISPLFSPRVVAVWCGIVGFRHRPPWTLARFELCACSCCSKWSRSFVCCRQSSRALARWKEKDFLVFVGFPLLRRRGARLWRCSNDLCGSRCSALASAEQEQSFDAGIEHFGCSLKFSPPGRAAGGGSASSCDRSGDGWSS